MRGALHLRVTVSGSISFSATEETQDVVLTEESVMVVSATCLEAMEELFEDVEDYTCDDFAADRGCTEYDVVGTDCVCTEVESLEVGQTLTYAVEGNNLTYRDSGEEAEVPFCVDGNNLWVDWGLAAFALEKTSGGETGEGGSGGETGEGGSGGTGPSLCDINWVPCGGTPNGTYTVAETCFAGESGSDEILGLPECDSPYTYTVTVSGSVSFTSTEETDHLVLTEELVTVISAACLEAMEELFVEVIDYTCADYADDWGCTEYDLVGTDCVCTQTETMTVDEVILYAVEGNNLTYRDSGYDYEIPFCVDGNTLTMDISPVVVLQK